MNIKSVILMASAAIIATAPALATNSANYCNKHKKYDNCDHTPTPVPTPTPTPVPTPTPTPVPTSNTNTNTSGSNSTSGALAGAVSGSKSNATSNSTSGANATGGKSSSTSGVGIGDVGSNSAAYSGGNKLTVNPSIYGGEQSNSNGDQTLTGGAQSLTGGDQSLSNDNHSGVEGSGNAAVNVDASDRSLSSYQDNSRVIFIPPIVPGTPPSQVVAGNIVKETLACGPLQAVIKTPIIGTSRGLFSKSQVNQGATYDLAPYTDKDGNIVNYRKVDLPDGSGYQLFGHQPILFTTVVGIANGANIAIGGGSGNGGWGQAGGGTSSSMTQLVTNIQLAQCEVGTVRYLPVEREVPKKKKGE